MSKETPESFVASVTIEKAYFLHQLRKYRAIGIAFGANIESDARWLKAAKGNLARARIRRAAS